VNLNLEYLGEFEIKCENASGCEAEAQKDKFDENQRPKIS
jgi:hypothetical protein